MRLIDDKLAVFGSSSFAVVKVTDAGEFELLDKKINVLRPMSLSISDRYKMLKIPRIEAKDISIEDQIRLSIDYNNGNKHLLYKQSIVDVHDGQISLAFINKFDISRYDVVKWDEKFVYCKFRDARPFTVLEQMFGGIDMYAEYFVKDGKLYAHEERKLMVFDIRSERIRKLGHFERLSDDFEINNIEVLDDGNILMSARNEIRSLNGKDYVRKSYLYLLKNPE
jgi:hypothetical protein